MDWSPNPLPEILAPRGPGWSGTGPAEPPRPGPDGIAWRPKQQGTGTSVSYAEFTAALRIYLSALSAATGVHTATLAAHLTGLMSARTVGGGEGEFIDNTLKVKLTAWTIAVSQTTARAAFSAKGTAASLAVFTATIQAHLVALSNAQATTTAALLAHLTGISTGTGAASATADFGAWGPSITTYSTAGTFAYPIPPASKRIELSGVSAGGGGAEGDGTFAAKGNGGKAGLWGGVVLVRGVDIPWDLASISITVPAGGPGAPKTNGGNPGTKGGDLVITWPGGSLTRTGGAGGSGTKAGTGDPGGSPGNYTTPTGDVLTGGAQRPSATSNGQTGAAGNAPGGGGGGGGGGYFNGQAGGGQGAPGMARAKAYQ